MEDLALVGVHSLVLVVAYYREILDYHRVRIDSAEADSSMVEDRSDRNRVVDSVVVRMAIELGDRLDHHQVVWGQMM